MTSYPNFKLMENLIAHAQVLDWLFWIEGPSQAYQLGKETSSMCQQSDDRIPGLLVEGSSQRSQCGSLVPPQA